MGRLVTHISRTGRRGWAFVRLNVGHVALFLTVNVVFGAAGIWMPVVAGRYRSGTWWDPLLTQFENAGPYTFAIAFLAACLSYLVAEYLDKRSATWKQWKVLLGLLAGSLIFLCTWLSAVSQPEGTSAKPPIATQNVSKQPKTGQEVSPSTATVQSKAFSPGVAELPEPHYVQAVLVAISVINGFLIFLTFLVLADPMKKAIAEIDAKLEDDTDALISGLPPTKALRGRRLK